VETNYDRAPIELVETPRITWETMSPKEVSNSGRLIKD
jgi:hypothetical protein